MSLHGMCKMQVGPNKTVCLPGFRRVVRNEDARGEYHSGSSFAKFLKGALEWAGFQVRRCWLHLRWWFLFRVLVLLRLKGK